MHLYANANGKTLPIWFWLLLLYPVRRSKGKISPFHKEYVRVKAGRFTRVGTRLSARKQLRACVKWDLVVRDFFIFFNFARQYFRFRSVIFFQIFGDN